MSDKINIVQQTLERVNWPETGRTLSPEEIKALDDFFLRVQKRADANLAAALQTVRLGTPGSSTVFVAATSGGPVTTQLDLQNGIVVPTGTVLPTDYAEDPFMRPPDASGRIPKNLP